MLALIDGDIICYRAGFATENNDESLALWQADEMIEGIIKDVGANNYQIWLSDSAENNFRYQVFEDYKANRRGKPRPKHLNAIKEHLIKNHQARISFGMEADDALGIHQDKVGVSDPIGEGLCNHYYTSVICSIDKDLLTIPGCHYNFVKKEMSHVTPDVALKTFYTSILVGDVADNIKGCPGIGVAKAAKLFERASNELELFEAVRFGYRQGFSKFWNVKGFLSREQDSEISDILLMTGQLLKIKQHEDEPLWAFPKQPPTMAQE